MSSPVTSVPAGHDPELDEIELVYSDGEPMESDWHVRNMMLLINQIDQHFKGRSDYYVGGNMFIYFSKEQAKNRDFRGPDFFVVKDTTREPMRDCWVVWRENGRTPNVVIELSSPSTDREDHGRKFEIYRDQLKVGNYFIYDRDIEALYGWKLVDGQYVAIPPDAKDRLECDELGLKLGTWPGRHDGQQARWLRFFTMGGKLVPTFAEAAEQFAERQREHAKAEKARADTEKARAEQKEHELATEKARADAIAAENARLKALLEKLSSQAE